MHYTGYLVKQLGRVSVKDTGYLDRTDTIRLSHVRLVAGNDIRSVSVTRRKPPGRTKHWAGYIVDNFYRDLYNRVVVIPHLIQAGAVSTDLHYTVHVWNACRYTAVYNP